MGAHVADREVLEIARGTIRVLAARIEALEQALREIAQQKLSDELDEHEREWADYHDGWDQAVKCARAALAQTGEANG